VRGTLETVQHAVNPLAAVHKDVKILTERIAELESKLREIDQHDEQK